MSKLTHEKEYMLPTGDISTRQKRTKDVQTASSKHCLITPQIITSRDRGITCWGAQPSFPMG
jgi:hypothetical protein